MNNNNNGDCENIKGFGWSVLGCDVLVVQQQQQQQQLNQNNIIINNNNNGDCENRKGFGWSVGSHYLWLDMYECFLPLALKSFPSNRVRVQ
jgi:hypothetical protein